MRREMVAPGSHGDTLCQVLQHALVLSQAEYILFQTCNNNKYIYTNVKMYRNIFGNV